MNTTTTTALDSASGRLSRRKMLGTALVVTGAAAAVSTLGTGTASAAAASPRGAHRPQGTGPEPLPELYFSLLTAPYRVYDSRDGQVPEGTDRHTGADDTPLGAGETRTIDVCYTLGMGMYASGVPETADGVMLNVTLVHTTGSSGYLKVWSDGVAEPNASAINWDHSGATIANSVTTACDGGYIQLKCGGASGASTDVVIDVVGYFQRPMP